MNNKSAGMSENWKANKVVITFQLEWRQKKICFETKYTESTVVNKAKLQRFLRLRPQNQM